MRLPVTSRARKASGSNSRSESGAALVEFSLIVSLLMVFLFGIITFGVLMAFKSSMTQAAEEGARSAIGVPYSDVASTAVSKASSSLWSGHTCGNAGMTCNVSIAACPDASGATHYCVTVKLTYDYAHNPIVPNIPLLDAAMPSQLTETAVVQLNDQTT